MRRTIRANPAAVGLAAVGLLAAALGAAGSAAANTRTTSQTCEGETVYATVIAADVRLQKGVREKQSIKVKLFPPDNGYTLSADDDNWVTTDSYRDGEFDYNSEDLDFVSTSGNGEWYKATMIDDYPVTGKHWVDVNAGFTLIPSDSGNGSTPEELYCFETFPEAATFFTRLDTNLAFNASPEPVKKGSKVKLSGKLTRLKPDQTGYGSYPGKPLKVYFDPKGTAGPVYKGTMTTRTDGTYSRYFTQNSSGTWKVVFTATSTYGGNAHSDYVAVS